MRILVVIVCVLAIQLWPVPSHSCCEMCWDVEPTPLDLMEEAGVRTELDSIAAVLSDPEQDVRLRWKAALALGQLCNDRATPMLLHALQDSEKFVRLGAAEALYFMPSPQLAKPLCRTAMTDPNTEPRHAAVRALSAIKSVEATDCLFAVVGNEQEKVPVRALATMLIRQQISEREGFEDLIPLLNDPDSTIRGEVAMILLDVYESEPDVVASLSIMKTLQDVVIDPEIQHSTLMAVIERLEQEANRDFMGEIHHSQVFSDSGAREFVYLQIKAWAAEKDPQSRSGE